jgi:hypothetical protein
MTLSDKIEIAGLVGGGLSFVVYAGLQIWSNRIQQQSVAVSQQQTRVFEEQNEIMRAQGAVEGSAMLRSIPLPKSPPIVPKLRLWPLIAIAGLFLVTLSVAGFDIYERHFGESISERSPISGTVDVEGGSESIKVPSIDMPYEAFCTADWNSGCFPQEKKDGVLMLAFQVTVPHDGGTVRYTITPVDPLKAYRQEASKVIDREATIKNLQSQVKQQTSKIETLTPQLSAWNAYHDKVVGVITDLEKQNCGQQAVDAQKIVDATQADMARLNVELQREKLQYPNQPHGAVYSDLNRDQMQLQNEQAAIQTQAVINSRLDTIRSAP